MMRNSIGNHWLYSLILVGLAGSYSVVAADSSSLLDDPARDKITYDKHIRPLFATRCASCHNPNKQSGDLDVTNYSALMEGGGSGESIVPGNAEDSYLFQLVIHEDSPEMPPEADKIPEKEISLLRKWIDGGALENSKSKFKAPKAKMAPAPVVSPGVRPKIIPNPCRLSKEIGFNVSRQPVVVASASSPWSPIVAFGGPRSILFYRSTDFQFLGVLPFPEGQVKTLRFAAAGQVLVAAGGRGASNGVVKLFDLTKPNAIISHQGELDAVLAADVDPSLKSIAFGGPDRLVKAVDVHSEEKVFQLKKHTDWVQAVRFSPDGVLLASGDRNGGLRVWEGDSGRDYLDLRGHKGGITCVDWSLDSNLLISGSLDGTIKAWEMENGRLVKSFRAHGNGVTDLKVNRKGQVVSIGRDRSAILWSPQGKQIRRFPVSSLPTSVSYCDETNRVLVSCFDGKTIVFDSGNGKKLKEILPAPKPLSLQLQVAKTQAQNLQKQFEPASKKIKGWNVSLAAETKSQTDLLAQKSRLEKELLKVEKQKKTMETALAALNTKIAASKKKTAVLAGNLKKLTESNRPIEAKLTQAKKTVLMLEQEIAFDRQLKSVHKKLAAARKRFQADYENHAKLKAEFGKWQVGFSKLESSNKQVHNQIAAWKLKMVNGPKIIASNKVKTQTNSQQLASKQSLLINLGKNITQMNSTHVALKESVKLDSGNPALVESLKKFESVLVSKKAESQKISQMIEQLKSNSVKLQKESTDLESEIQKGPKLIEKLTAQWNQGKSVLATKTKERVKLLKNLEDAKLVVGKSQNEVSKIQLELKALRTPQK